MAVNAYKTVVAQWHPDGGRDRRYHLIVVVCLVLAAALALALAAVSVPEAERPTRQDIPDRVARFITERPEPVVAPQPPPEPEPKPVPQIEPRPVVQRERVREITEPLTEQEQQARERAEQSGLFGEWLDRKSTRLNSSHVASSYAVFCLKKKKKIDISDMKW